MNRLDDHLDCETGVGEYSARVTAVSMVLCFALATVMCSSILDVSASSEQKTVTVTISHVHQYDPIDVVNAADMYVSIYVNGVKKTSSVWQQNTAEVNPNWSQTWTVTYDTSAPDIPVKIVLRDEDISDDDTFDIDRETGKGSCDLVLNMETGDWTGDDGYAGDILPGLVDGDDLPDGSTGTDEDDGQVGFDIILGL